ncbi:MAG: ParB N-terminal domain-containing protein [Anaerolineae bacterium]|nr:ParB N-terminal domain-containing protein [Anaerolineae bacterium]MCB0179355.1 ParB N-terminal domain-containing protein [Anaerolineae bacterium]MCB0224700.1 ParB N-terminal domain-containing protein [Anaerolineae bacterium]MCB9103669.1 ParB N-terminal domain-containing protein [Anaerolineales bacterium]
MNIVNTNMQTMAFVKSDAEFNRAKVKGFWQTVLDRILGRRTHLLPFSGVMERLDLRRGAELGLKDIPLAAVVGSVSRSEDFTRDFSPCTSSYLNRERWRGIYTLVTTGAGIPAIEVYLVDGDYYVIDGHHRVSVAKHLGWSTIQAHVTELPAPVEAAESMLVDFYERGGLMSLNTQTPTVGFGESMSAPTPLLRLILYKNEVCRIPQAYSEVKVVSGNAWLTMDGRDMFLVRGERASLASHRDTALISALGKTPLVLEVRSEEESSDLLGLVPQQVCS